MLGVQGLWMAYKCFVRVLGMAGINATSASTFAGRDPIGSLVGAPGPLWAKGGPHRVPAKVG